MEINRIGNTKCWIKKNDFRSGGWLIGGRPTGLLIWADHLFLNYFFFLGSGGWLILGVLLILTWHYIYIYAIVMDYNDYIYMYIKCSQIHGGREREREMFIIIYICVCMYVCLLMCFFSYLVLALAWGVLWFQMHGSRFLWGCYVWPHHGFTVVYNLWYGFMMLSDPG